MTTRNICEIYIKSPKRGDLEDIWGAYILDLTGADLKGANLRVAKGITK